MHGSSTWSRRACSSRLSGARTLPSRTPTTRRPRPQANIQVFDTQNTLLQAVTAGRVDAAALTNISLNDLVKNNPGAGVEVTEGFFPMINGKEVISAGGFVFRQGDNDLLQAFNAELKRLHESGEWLQVAQPFGFTQENVPGPDVTTESLCSET
jgi:polar amino acid transport system substrate-binding protein